MRKRRRAPSSIPAGQSSLTSDPAATPSSWSIASRSLADTERFGHMIGEGLQGGEVLALYGDVGTGKTALIRGIATGLGASPRSVSSPTFVLIHEYRGRLPLAHADLYRLESAQTVPHLGLEEYFDGHTVVAVEWAERAMSELPLDRVELRFTHQSRTERAITVTATGPHSHQALTRIFCQAIPLQSGKPPRSQASRSFPK
jgi:tRNA threonylcarbamoyladenosine biosynthesis protein TsaE